MNIIKVYKGKACILCNRDTESESDICEKCYKELLDKAKKEHNEKSN